MMLSQHAFATFELLRAMPDAYAATSYLLYYFAIAVLPPRH